MGGDEGSLGSGAYLFGGSGFRLAPRLAVEVDVMRVTHERHEHGFQAKQPARFGGTVESE
jgi:hypothetical protein